MLNEHVTKLRYKDKEIILVSTAHVSENSVALVRDTIAIEQPDSVCVELDDARYKTILDPNAWQKTNVSTIIKEKKVSMMLVQLALSSYQKKMAKKLGTKVGGEMLQGIESAKEVGAKLVLADRNIQTTFSRLWRLLRFREKVKIAWGLLGDDESSELTEEDFTALLEKDMLASMLTEVGEAFPVIAQVIIHERDQYLAHKIKNAPGEKVLAILGGAHVPGVIMELEKEQDIAKITHVPQKKSRVKWVGWLIPLIVIGLIVYGFTLDRDLGMQNLYLWWLWNGGLAAGLTLLARGHILSVLTAFFAAPITSLNPLLAAGWFAGLMEAWVRKPKVEDLQDISEDIFSFMGWWHRNRFLKVLLVVMVANLGSTAGTLIGGAEILRNLFGG